MSSTQPESTPALRHESGFGAFLAKTILGAGGLLQSFSDSGRMLGPWCDVLVNRFIVEAIASTYPAHGYVSEEGGSEDKGWENLTWIIDPIDGSENFYRGILSYSISISLVRCDDVLIGAVYEPYLRRLFYGEKGKGATLNGRPIHVSATSNLSEAVIAVSRCSSFLSNPFGDALVFQRLVEGLNVRISASTALDMCCVAIGALDGRVMANTRQWDNSAATLLVREAGGMVTDWEGRFPAREDRKLLATNGNCHTVLLDYLGSAGR